MEKEIRSKITISTEEAASNLDKINKKLNDFRDGFDNAADAVGNFFDTAFSKDLPELTDNINSVSGALDGLQAGFSAVQELAAMAGIENENIAIAMDKVAKAQEGISKVQQIASTVQKAYAGTTQFLATAKRALNAATKASSKGLKLFKIALASTGIGLLITGLGILIANFDGIKKAITAAAEKFPPLKKAIDAVKKVFDSIVGAAKRFLDWLGFTSKENKKANDAIAKTNEAAAKKAEELRKKAEKEREEAAAREKKAEEKRLKEREKRRKEDLKKEQQYRDLLVKNMKEGKEKELAEEDLKYQKEKEKLRGNKKALEQLAILHKNNIAKINSEWDAKEKEAERIQHETLLKENAQWLKDENSEFKKAQKEKQSQLKDDLAALKDKNKDAQLADKEAMIKGTLTKQQFDENERKRELALLQDRKDTITNFYTAQQTDIENHYDNLLATELQKKADGQLSNEEFDAIKADLDKQKEESLTISKAEQVEKEKAAERALTEERLNQLQEDAKRELAIRKAKNEAAVKITQDSVNLLGQINDLLVKDGKKQNQIQKTLALVKIGIDTAKAISSALANANSPTPDNVATGGLAGIAKFVAISAQILTAAAQAKSVLSSSGQGSAGGSTPSAAPAAPTIAAPQITAPQLGSTPIIHRQPNPEPIKVFVSEADIRNTQNKVAVIEGQSEVV